MSDSSTYSPPVVPCPACGTDVAVSLPRSSEILSVTTDPDDPPEAAEQRRRRTQDACPRGHGFVIVYEW